jgi:predicted dehydrogenase
MPTTRSLARRDFLQVGAATLAAAAAGRPALAAADTLVVAVMGVNKRGSDLISDILKVPGIEVGTIVEVDEKAADRAAKKLEDGGRRRPAIERDIRRTVAEKGIDAVVIAAPNHWHAPATILAAAHGKHVYCEKPVSHNPREGELMVEAQRKHGVVVQIGTQRRSFAATRAAIDLVRGGRIGKVLHARAWYGNRRGPMGRGKKVPVPANLDWELWQGPAPERDYLDNIVHYNWHWLWHWGGGEMANNGPHMLDLCRWGLGVDYPTRVTALGGRLRYDDDQQTPDTLDAVFDFEGRTIAWELQSWSSRGRDGLLTGAEFLGETGSIVVDPKGSYALFDEKNKPVPQEAKDQALESPAPHMANFAACIRGGGVPNADVLDGHKSTLRCHLGNIAYRTGLVLDCDPTNGRPKNCPAADALWSREYRPDWQPVV